MKVFISRTHSDDALAKRLAIKLREAGMEVWDEQMILPGDNWAEKVAEALRESEAMIALLSQSALSSSRVWREIEYALGERRFKRRLIPILVGSSKEVPLDEVPWILKRLQVLQLPERQDDESLKQIAETLMDALDLSDGGFHKIP